MSMDILLIELDLTILNIYVLLEMTNIHVIHWAGLWLTLPSRGEQNHGVMCGKWRLSRKLLDLSEPGGC